MSSRWGSLLLALVALPAAGEAQQVRELGVYAVATASDPALVAGGIQAALRPSRRLRLSAGAAAGAADGEAAFRGELLAHFLLAPRAGSGIGGYAAGGIAMVAGPVDEGYLVLTLGAESRPGGSSGWFVEAGAGGGARLVFGYRRRWSARPG